MTVITRHRAELLLTAAATALATYSLFSLYQSRSRRSRRADLADQVNRALASGAAETRIQPSPPLPPIPNTEPTPEREQDYDYAEELVREQLARNYAFLREDGVSRVRAASVVIVGCGGVGSWTAVMLARSGVAKLRLIDFDYVTLSSLNRHATAALADVGTPKVECIARALRAIAPFVQVEPRVELWRGDSDGAELLRGADWVVGTLYILFFFCLLPFAFCLFACWRAENVVDAFFLWGVLQMRSIILVQRSNCLRTACRIISKCSLLWVQGPSPTRRVYRSQTSPRLTMILLLAQCVNASVPPSPDLPVQRPLRPPPKLPRPSQHQPSFPPPPPPQVPKSKSRLKPEPTRRRRRQQHRANTPSQWSTLPRFQVTWRYSHYQTPNWPKAPSTSSRRCEISACVFCPCSVLSPDSSVCTLRHTCFASLRAVRSNDLCRCAIARNCMSACGRIYSTASHASRGNRLST